MDWLVAKDPEKICKASRHEGYIYIRKCSRNSHGHYGLLAYDGKVHIYLSQLL